MADPSSAILERLRTGLAERYAVERELGRGGMATVFLAQDVRHSRPVAVKVLDPELAATIGAERFLREIRIAARLTHPHILPLHDSGDVDGILYYVMPYVEGESLKDRIARERQLPVDDALRIACQVSSALDYAHRHGVVHRDVKPANILLEDGHAIVADFGIARAVSAAGGDRLTESGVSLGTAAYMSPEQGAGERELDGRTDMYALGCVVYEMLAGQPPFVGATAQSVIARHAVDPVPRIRSVRPTLPENAETAIMQALAKAPADRFQTVAQFADVLSQCGASMIVQRSGVTGVAGRRWTRGRVAAIAGGLAVAAVLVTALWLNEGRTRSLAAGSVAAGLDQNRLAVLYFDDMSLGQEYGHLADGLTEGLIDQLSEVRALDVVSRNGVEPFRNAELAPDSIARALGAASLIEGSVEEVGDRLRVTVRLIDGATGDETKSGSFERPVAEVLALREELTTEVSRFLRERMGDEVRLRAQRLGTRDAEAWSLVQRAERTRKRADALLLGDDAAGATAALQSADSMLAAAEALDARWAEPAVLRSVIAFRRARLGDQRAREGELVGRGLEHAQRALANDPRSARALEMRGTLNYWKWLRGMVHDHDEAATLIRQAEADLRAATQINPGQASAWNTLSHLHFQKPDFIEAKLAAVRAYEEDAYLTVAPDVLWRLYTTSYELEQPDAERWCREGRTRFPRNPRFVQCQLWLMTSRLKAPDVDEAWRLHAQLRELTPAPEWPFNGRMAQFGVAAVTARAGLADSARRVADRARAGTDVDPERELMSFEAFVHVVLGDRDRALRVLKEYLTTHPEHRAGLARSQSWWWRDLRDDPRFRELVGTAE
jgi:serine/threonine-protein kinase